MPVVADIITNYKQEILKDRPAGYWPLDGGTFAIDYRPTPTPAPGLFSGTIVPSAGGVGRGMRFISSANSYSRVSSAPVAAAPLTLEAWCSPATVAANQTVLSITGSGSNNDWFRLTTPTATGGLSPAADKNSSGGFEFCAASSSAVFRAGDVMHLVGTFANGVICLYVNGRLSATNTYSAAPSSLDRTTVGVLDRPTITEYADAVIAHAAIYPTALSPGRIAAHYNALANPRARRVYSIPSGGTVASRLLNLRRKVMVAA